MRTNSPHIPGDPESGTVTALRGTLLVLFIVGSVGTGVELLLLGHTEDTWQWTPLVLMGLGVPVLAWLLVATTLLSIADRTLARRRAVAD